MSRSDGSTAEYYVLPEASTQLQDLISHRDMNSQIGEIFRACYRYGIVSHSDKMRDAKKIRFYAQAEVERLEKLEQAVARGRTLEECANLLYEQPSHIISDIPSWDDAPEWAEWVASDDEGWFWFASEPTKTYKGEWTASRYEEVDQDGFSGKECLSTAKYKRPAGTAQ